MAQDLLISAKFEGVEIAFGCNWWSRSNDRGRKKDRNRP